MVQLNRPYFSIIIPIKGHPLLLSDALTSVLRQDFSDLEVIVSNNGADPGVKQALAPFVSDARLRYVEQLTVLDMPTHFEALSKMVRGRYLTLLTHRSVLKRNALSVVREAHERYGEDGAVVSWAWDLYYEDKSLLVANPSLNDKASILDSDDALLGSLSTGSLIPYSLPRALNSSVSMEVVESIRNVCGEAFGKINPDFNFAYRCLMSRTKVVHIQKALMISQGFSISYGGEAYRGDARSYLGTLGLTKPFEYAPIKADLVENTIVEDFLKNAAVFERSDLVARWDRAAYYVKCLKEVNEKRIARLISVARVNELDESVRSALARETNAVQDAVAAQPISSLQAKFRRMGRQLLGPKTITAIRPIVLRLQGATRYKSVLSACGLEEFA